MRRAKNGVTRESVLALRVILADGRELRTGRETIKSFSGYDLNALMIGSPGTLGLVVESTLRLPRCRCTPLGWQRSSPMSQRQPGPPRRRRPNPAMELMDGPTLEVMGMATGTGYRSKGGAFLLVQTDGFGSFLEEEVVMDVLEPLGSCEKAVDDEYAAALLTARRKPFSHWKAGSGVHR